MSPREVELFLAGGRLCRLATVGSDGTPHVVPVWYVVMDGEIYLSTSANTAKARNLERFPRAALVVDEGWTFDDFRGVMLQGRVERVDDALAGRVSEAFAYKYFGSNRHPGFLFLEGMAGRVLLRFIPERTVSWYSRRMGGGNE